ncbi:MAG: CpsD/CapB family tyrosine-protein kinase [Candidatus Fusobacterium pullicola]|uniref:non-specific protein-tyrosine kinase n=3 Tax=Fusobacterium TaxID=848 RepID=A0ABS2G3K8_FUSMR|nr:CpsD/CapB family tyrosine-protein kinase [Fusobacterium mortiferum]MBM6875328.1 CpsD/CapB family tyrosine-protein kinase [Fusobacterium mortiferum]MBU3841883.1 CpsD/CapB family tyrosine-protein kinase [Candidatus Fusobacterium pullicola]
MRRGIFFESENLKEGGEAIRLIRSNINFMDTTDHKIITFCSSVPKEGKTTIASNYALSEAITGKKVLLIDCDIKRPRINEVYETEHKKGIVELLEGKATFEEVIQREVRKNLDIIFCSKKREETTELILSKNLESHLKELQSEYDLIVVDTPPLTIGTDAAIISRFSTGVVFVISYDQVHRVELEFAKKLLTTAKANLYGAVINKVSTDGYFYEPYGYYSYNYKYYKNYYKDGEK